MRLFKVLITSSLFSIMLSTSLMADSKKGEKLFKEKIEKGCGEDGVKLAKQNSSDEWILARNRLQLEKEFVSHCPNKGFRPPKLKLNETGDIADFLIENAWDM